MEKFFEKKVGGKPSSSSEDSKLSSSSLGHETKKPPAKTKQKVKTEKPKSRFYPFKQGYLKQYSWLYKDNKDGKLYCKVWLYKVSGLRAKKITK